MVLGTEAWRYGVELKIQRVEGSLFSPVVIYDSEINYLSHTGAATRTFIARTEIQADYSDFLHGNFQRWFKSLKFAGINSNIKLPRGTPTPAVASHQTWLKLLQPRGHWLAKPERIEAGDVDLRIESDQSFVHVEQSHFVISQLEMGSIFIGQLSVKEPWLERSFRNIRGTTVLQDAKLLIANLRLEPGIEIQSLSSQFEDLAKGELNVAISMAAFDGEIQAETRISPELQPLSFELSAKVKKAINIAKLANFLKLSDAAGGTIQEGGKIKFRGSPQQLDRATASIWLEANNFQWESRQWNSLAFGAEIMDRRMQVWKLDLLQGANRLNLNGEMSLPTPDVKWWQGEFTCNLSATIKNLTELSALMLPEFKFAAGQVDIVGSIRGRKQQFDGPLIISGSHIKWHNAPIENLHAALNLEGNTCKISNLEIFNSGDYVRGRGVVNILGATQYWGELRASVEDLATYSAILQKPIVPEPLAGRAVLEWSGEGSANGQSGKFLASLNKVRFLGALASQLHPINIHLDGSYGKGSMQFSKFALSDDESSFSANVGVGNKALSLQHIRLMHGAQVVLVGDALLPLDVWQAWPNTSLSTLLNPDTVSDIHLEATGLDLRRASQLAGWNFPIAGLLNGTLSTSGPISALKTGGRLDLSHAQLPLGWSGESLAEVEASATFQGQDIQLEKLTAKHRFGDLNLTGLISLLNLSDPVLKLHAESSKTTIPLFQQAATAPLKTGGPKLSTQVDLQIEGPLSAASVHGTANLAALEMSDALDLSALWWDAGNFVLSPLFSAQAAAPWATWSLDIACQTAAPAPLSNSSGNASVDMHIGGTGNAPSLGGKIQLNGFQATAGSQTITVETATLTFKEDRPRNPTLELQASGTTFNEPFTAQVTGPLSHLIRSFNLAPPLSDALLMETLAGKKTAPPPAAPLPTITLRAPEALINNAAAEFWPPIPTPTDTAPDEAPTVSGATNPASTPPL